jgi:DNA topoisomerase-1
MLTQLVHHGVLVPEAPPYRGLTLTIRGRAARLTPKQEEMALAWAKKQGTPHVEDRTFARNFLGDFSRELGLDRPLRLDEVDFGPALRIVEEEKAERERRTPEERKVLAAERKVRREALREQYGYAIVNGERVELANFTVEPSSIFMGRGEHPLRGRWKEGARQSDIILNLSPDAPRPAGEWGSIVWQPESLWVAAWRDKLSDELKYVWLADTAPIKQSRDASKFDKAHDLHAQIEAVRARIQEDLADANPRQRMLATACYLIDALCLRVGDEKDPDEADTVGATTLRPEHLTLHPDGVGEFRFLGKDSVLWHKKIPLPEAVRANLEELSREARPSRASRDGKPHPTRDKPQLFPDIGSQHVNAYLGRIMPGLTAKVFRTHHATMTVRDSLAASGVQDKDPEFRKWEAVSEANLRAAELCNHYKQAPKSWKSSRARFQEREKTAQERVLKARAEVKALEEALAGLRQEAAAAKKAAAGKKAAQAAARYKKKIEQTRRKLEAARERLQRALLAHGALRAQSAIANKRRTWNLQTSLKSYIDPRVYHRWGESVGYDVLARYYPKTLQRRFSWARQGGEGEAEDAAGSDAENAETART